MVGVVESGLLPPARSAVTQGILRWSARSVRRHRGSRHTQGLAQRDARASWAGEIAAGQTRRNAGHTRTNPRRVHPLRWWLRTNAGQPGTKGRTAMKKVITAALISAAASLWASAASVSWRPVRRPGRARAVNRRASPVSSKGSERWPSLRLLSTIARDRDRRRRRGHGAIQDRVVVASHRTQHCSRRVGCPSRRAWRRCSTGHVVQRRLTPAACGEPRTSSACGATGEQWNRVPFQAFNSAAGCAFPPRGRMSCSRHRVPSARFRSSPQRIVWPVSVRRRGGRCEHRVGDRSLPRHAPSRWRCPTPAVG